MQRTPTHNTFIVSEVECISLISHNLDQFHDVCMIQLTKNFDFAHSGDRKTFHLIFQAYFFQRNKIPCKQHNQQLFTNRG